MKIISTLFLLCFTTLLSITIATAQDVDCTALMQQFIEQARKSCPEVGVNQACYGSGEVTIEPLNNVRVAFSKPGDIVSLAALKAISTSTYNPQTKSDMAIAILNIGGNFPGTGSTVIAFGATQLNNLSSAPADFVALDGRIGATGAKVRELPSADSSLLGTRFAGDTVAVIGRLTDNSWFRLPDGWIVADSITIQEDVSLLPVLDADSQASDIYGPMQIFQLHTGSDDAPCAGMPDSGILVQNQPTSQRAGLLNVNGMPLGLSGTIWLKTTDEGETVLSVLDGTGNYAETGWQAGESTQYGYQGDVLSVGQPEDYNYARARYLPLQLLPREFELPFSLGGVIFPFTPGTGFLNGIAPDAACTVAWTVDVNIRSGPGTDYPIRRGVSGGYYGLPDARAVGTDGEVWWRLLDGVWLAANNTAAGGACGTLPLVEPPPLPTTP